MIEFERRAVMAQADRYATTNSRPEWARVREAAQMIGIKRSRFYEILSEAQGRIKTLVLKSKGAKSGARLIHVPSLLGYMDYLATECKGGADQCS
jgi:hypothetical protein